MIPEDCAVAVSNGVTSVVGPLGDIRQEYDETGLYANDIQYLQTCALYHTDRDAPTMGWDRITRRAGPDGVTTVLSSGAVGEGRGDVRPLVLEKRVRSTDAGVAIASTLRNYTPEERIVDVEVDLGSSFDHVFESAGFFSPRSPIDRTFDLTTHDRGVTLSARSADGETRSVTVELDDTTDVVVDTDGDTGATLTTGVTVPAGGTASLTASATITPARVRSAVTVSPSVPVTPETELFAAARDTLSALLLPEGVPAAGAPRFVAPFGRDALIVGIQTLPFDPQLTRSVLQYCSGQQGTTTDADTLEAPGKIPHEKRHGDLPAVGESIRTPYYGTVDATPLYAALVSEYAEWAGGDAVDDDLYDAARNAVEWVREEGDDAGLLWYEPHDHEYGLSQLGWKDSARAIAHPDGTTADPPIALAEVQGYAYRGLVGVADLARDRGDDDIAATLDEHAAALRARFDEAFWLPEERCYALALDDNGVVPTVASNQGHALWSGIVPEKRADDVIDRLLNPDMLTDAGLRTVAASHEAFDPLSYHRGSVWPHDTSLATLGFARYGRTDAVRAVVGRGLGALEDSVTTNPERWGFPELLVGLDTPSVDPGRVHHPDSCEPAAWSAGSAFGFLQAALGLSVSDRSPSVDAALPTSIGSIRATIHCRGTEYALRCTDDSLVVTPTSRGTRNDTERITNG